MIAPKVIRRPAVRMVTSRPEDNSTSMPAGASTEQPVTILPSMSGRREAAFGMEGHRHMFHVHACTRGAAPRKGRDAGLFVIAVTRFIDLMPLMPRRLCARCLAVKK